MHLQLRLFKQFDVAVNGTPIDGGKWRGSTLRSLLQYIATRRGMYATSDEIIETFWPDFPLDKARTNLQAAISRLRATLKSSVPGEAGEQLILFTGVGYRLPEGAQVDLWELHHRARELRKLAVQHPAGALKDLDELVIPDPRELLPEHPFSDWAAAARKQAQEDAIALHLLRADLRQQARRRRDAMDDLMRILALEPAREAVAQLAMRLAADLGDRPAALEIFHRCRTALAEELGLDPTPEFLALHAQILRDDPAAGALSTGSPDQASSQMAVKRDRTNNLPTKLSSFVGREQDVTGVCDLLRQPFRLITLTGPGGSGKTRLSLEIGRSVLDSFADGVWLVELAELRDNSLLDDAVAATFDLQGAPGLPPLEVLRTYLESRRVLLILDNCEHLAEGCARLVSELLQSCAHLQILTTSRQSLGVPGELLWSVSPLPIPDPRTTTTLEQFQQSPSVRLFADRARSVFPRFEITEENAPYIALICRCLDGMPLALELAAARARLLPVREIAERLRDRFRFLTHGGASSTARHQTLRNTLDWGYELLSEEERTLLRRLSVFAGSFGLEGAEAICSGPDLAPSRVLDLLHDLVDKSLVTADLQAFPARFKLLETIREYAAERLEQAGETSATWQRGLRWWLDLAQQAEVQMLGPDQVSWYERLDAELDNLRIVLDWAYRFGESLVGLQVALSLWRFWVARNHSDEGVRRLDLLLSSSRAQAPLQLQAKALVFLAGLCLGKGDVVQSNTYAQQARAAAEETEDPFLRAQAWGLLGASTLMLGDVPAAVERLRTSIALAEAIGDEWTPAEASMWLGVLAWLGRDLPGAEALLNRSYDVYSRRGDLWNQALTTNFLARVFVEMKDYERGRATLRETIGLYMRMRDERLLSCTLTNLARVEMEQGNPVKAVGLIGLVDALIERNGATVATWVDWVAWVRAEYHQVSSWGRTALTEAEHREAYQAGRLHDLDEWLARIPD